MVSISAIAGCAICLLFAPAAATAEPAVWTIRDADSEIVLFGSVHVLPDGLDWRPAALDAALAKADDIWFETPVDQARDAETGRLALELGVLGADQSLLAMLSPEGRAHLDNLTERLGLSQAVIDRLKPWLADITVSLAATVSQGGAADSGVERSLLAEVPDTTRRYFETPEAQIAMFAETPFADQLASLEETLKQLDEEPDLYKDLVQAWLNGDQAAIGEMGLTGLKEASPILYERLVAARNRRWVETIIERLAGSGETVIVVGAAHLTGPDSVPAMLRARGIPVEGP